MSPFKPRARARHNAQSPQSARPVVPGFWSAVPTREALSLDHRRRIADSHGAADIVTANGMVLSLR